MKALYAIARPLLGMLPPEAAHGATLAALRILPHAHPPADPAALHQRLFGLDFPNPIGLAAGFDKNAAVPDALLALGFGFVEVGTLTPEPQSGNPKPRLFRLPRDRAVINRLGFNNEGHAAARARLAARGARPGLIGINIGANRSSSDPISDYVKGLSALGPFGHYVTINISSPNTPGLRGLQARAPFEALLSALGQARAMLAKPIPLFVKIAPDLETDALADIVALALAHGVDGLIISNTTTARPADLLDPRAQEAGGLSGRPLFQPSTTLLAAAARLAQGRLVLVGVGGVASGHDAYAKIRAGARLVQLYTALAYDGPGLVQRIKTELATCLARDGFATLTEAVGADLKSGPEVLRPRASG